MPGRSLWQTSSEQVAFASALSARLRALAPLYDVDDAMRRDPEWWSKVMQDSSMAHAIRFRLAKVVRADWNMDSGAEDDASKTIAAIGEEHFRLIRSFGSSRRHFAKFAFHGNAHGWLEGRREWGAWGASEDRPAGFLAEWWRPTYLRPLDKRQILLVPKRDPMGRVEVEVRLATVDGGLHMPLLHPECLISVVYDDEVERLGSGRGLGEAIYKSFWQKGDLEAEWLRGVQRWSQGAIVYKCDRGGLTQEGKTNEQVVDEIVASMKTMGAGGVIVADREDEIDVVFADSGASDTAERAVAHKERTVAQLVLGSVLPTGGGEDVGSNARAEEEADSTEDLLDVDRELLDEAITERVVKLWFELNQPAFAEHGLAGGKQPRFRSTYVREETPAEAGENLERAVGLGLPVGQSEGYRRLGLSKPDANEPLLEAPKPDPMLPGMGGPPGAGGGFPFSARPKRNGRRAARR